MPKEDPISFTLSDDTLVIIRKLTNNKYDFELTLPNGSHKTFLWSGGSDIVFKDRNGDMDALAQEAVQKLVGLIGN